MRYRFKIFTIVELLIVISIITILASMLLPVLKTVKEKGRQISCANNQKNIHLAMNYYCEDQNGYLPVGSNAAPQGSWCFMISDYLNFNWPSENSLPSSGNLIFWCPSSTPQISSGGYATGTYQKFQLLSYGYNGYFYSDQPTYSIQRKKLAMLQYPSTVLLFDDYQYPAETNQPVHVGTRVNNARFRYGLNQDTIAWRHGYADNVAFADGHLEPKKLRPDLYLHGCRLYDSGEYIP